MRFVHTTNAICATTETGRVSGAILRRPPEWSALLWDRVAPQVCELLSAQPRGVTCADLMAQGYLKPLSTPDWKEGDVVRYTGRTTAWYIHGNEYLLGPDGLALRPGSSESCAGRAVATEMQHYCTWPLNTLARKFEKVEG
jgi:hypothetical protein